jgi:hypothetical protein
MAQAIIDTKKLLHFINGFGDNIEDLQLEIKDNRVYGAVDVPTHYCEKSISIMVSNDVKYRPGKVYLSDVSKVLAFLKASSQELCILTQWDGSFNLKLGTDSLQIPSHTHIRSAMTVDRAKAAIGEMKLNNYTKIGPSVLTVNGNISIIEMKGMSVGVKVAGKDAPCRVVVNPMDGEMIITIGNIVGGANMSRTIQLPNVTGDVETTTYFGSHLPSTLRCMGSGMVDFYMGEHAALILEHQEEDTLLILKHQQGVN